jgi:ABC-2 type transport system ATP-binding protein
MNRRSTKLFKLPNKFAKINSMESKPAPNIIKVSGLTKKFKDFVAVDHISFGVKRGDIFASLGPNGAGKSTTIKILITLMAATSGKASVAGFDVSKRASDVRKSIGYVPQQISVDGSLTAYENLMLFARLYDIPRHDRQKRIAETLAFLNLEKHSNDLVRKFSGGMVRKMEVGQAMLHKPKVLFLDEPTSGLDPIARQSVWEHILKLRQDMGTTIFFSTHYMEEAESFSDMVAIMNHGRIAAIGTALELKARTGKANAPLEDAFIFFAGDAVGETGNFREIRQARQTEKRLG